MMPKVRIGRKTRYLKPAEFLEATYNQYNTKRVFEYVLTAAPELEPSYTPIDDRVSNILEFERICDEYFRWLADIICESGQVLPLEVYHKLEELGL